MREKIISCLNNIGIMPEGNANFELVEYLQSSLLFIAFITELESVFDIEIPPEYLRPDKLPSLDSVCSLVESLTGCQG